jgi:hypothetical protein
MLIGSEIKGELSFYLIYSINGAIRDCYEWDGFLLIFSGENIMLFKPPIDVSGTQSATLLI